MRKGISPIIGFVITVSLISVAVTIVLAVINPAFNKVSDSTNTNDIMKNIELINSAIRQVASESEGSKRTISINSGEGNCFVNSTGDYIYCDYETKTDYSVEGTIGNVRIDKSLVFMDYFNHYTEGSSGSPLWTVKNGTWAVNSGEYSGQDGLAYYHHGNLGFFSLESRITNKSGVKAEVFALPVMPDNLIGYWIFDEGIGTETYDYSGYNRTCIFVDSPSWTAGKFEYGLQFDGSDDEVSITSFSDMGATVALWKKNSTDGDWYHLVNSSGTLYVNGIAGSGQIVPITNSSGTVTIGVDGSGGHFNGMVDEVMIFNSTLSADQIKSLYETSWKKISSTGKSDEISQKTDVYLVLSVPVGHTHFDEVKLKTNKRELRLSIPYFNVDLNGTARFSKGNYQLTITHKGLNTTVNKPIVEVMVA